MFLIKRLIKSLSNFLIVSLCLIVFCMSSAGAASNVVAIEAAVTAYKTIGALRKESLINGDAIAAAYAGALQTLAQEVDTANTLNLDSDILAAIDEVKSGNEPSLAAQVIDKTLQRVFIKLFGIVLLRYEINLTL